MKKYYYILIIPFFLFFIKTNPNPTISFFFQPLSDLDRMSKKLKKPGNLAKHTINGIANHAPIAGILVSYSGYITASDFNGEVIFPRKQQGPTITIVVTPEAKPIALFENTIHHWELLPNVPAAMYLCEQHYDDKNQQYYWQTKEIDLPADRKIPLASIIISAKPKNIVVPSGKVNTRETANLVLPSLYVLKGINIVKNSVYMLTVRHLFKPVNLKHKREPLHIITHIID